MLLGEAASKGDLAVVERWLDEQGIEPDDESHHHNPYEFGGERTTPLWCAAFCGHAEAVTALRDAGADPEWVDSNGWTGLHISATLGHRTVAERLIQGGAMVDARDVHGTTPLMYVAAGRGDAGCAEILLRHGATPTLRATGGRFVGKAAKQIAVEMGKAAVAALLSNKATDAEEQRISNDDAALVPATEPPVETMGETMGEAAFRGDLAAVVGWLGLGIAPSDERHFRADPGDYWGRCSPLWWAAAEGHTEVVAALQGAGADSEWANATGWTTLHISARLGHEHTVRQLVEGGAEVNAVTRSGATALMWAAAFDKPSCIEVLLGLCADPHLEDKAGRTALRIAAFRGHAQSCRRLVEGRAKLDATNKHGMTALMFAAYWDQLSCVEVLLRMGADHTLCATSGGCMGATALQIADRQGKPEVALMLEDAK